MAGLGRLGNRWLATCGIRNTLCNHSYNVQVTSSTHQGCSVCARAPGGRGAPQQAAATPCCYLQQLLDICRRLGSGAKYSAITNRGLLTRACAETPAGKGCKMDTLVCWASMVQKVEAEHSTDLLALHSAPCWS